MTWLLEERRYVPELHPWRESVMTTANGTLSTRGSLEEAHPGRQRATFVSGRFVTPAGGIPRQPAVADWTDVRITVDGEPVGVHHGWVIGQQRTLDLRTGELVRELLWRGEHTATVAVVFRRILAMHDPELAAMQLSVTPLDGEARVDVETGLDASVGSPDIRLWRPLGWDRADADALQLTAASVDDAEHLHVGCRVAGTPSVPALLDDPFHRRFRTSSTLAADTSWVLDKRVRYRSGRPGEVDGRELTPPVTPFDGIVSGSRTAWDRLWATATIEIDGDPDTQLALRYAAYQLLGAAPRDDRASIPAKLLSGFGYLGHVFWDTDVFMAPWLTMTTPDLAANHLAYRHRGLPAARRKARRYGRDGAFFPWEADDRGEECTPDVTTPHSGGPPIPVHTARYEEHISSDVAWMAWDHQRWTGDPATRERVTDLVLDTARYWGQRVEVDADGSGHLRDVIGPDEYHERIDDCWYTNRMVRWHLSVAADLLEQQGAAGPGTGSRPPRGHGPGDDVAELWRERAAALTLLTREDGVPLAYAGFDELQPIDLERWRPRRTTMERLLGEEIHRVQVTKQADVVMGLALLGLEAAGSRELAAAAFDRYLPLTDHGSSLSVPVHAWVAARLHRPEEAYGLLRAGIAIEHDDAMGNGAFGLHGATNGGLLLATLRGFAGVTPGTDGPHVDPALPSHWKRLGFTVVHRGRSHDLEVR